MTLKYTIPIPPVTKKNSQRIFKNRRTGRSFVAPSEWYGNYEKAAIWYLRPPASGPISTPCNVRMLFYMPTKRRVDLVNLQEAALDVLVLAGVLSDDSAAIVASMDGSRVLRDKEHPRTEIEITGVKKEA